MDRASGKRGAVPPRKAYSVTAIKGTATESDQNSQFCNRIGCSGRIKFSQNASIGNSDKRKCSKPSLCSSNGNEIMDKSTRSSLTMKAAKRSCLDFKGKMSSQVKSDPSKSSLSSELGSSSSNLGGFQLESTGQTKVVGKAKGRSSSASSHVGSLKIYCHKSTQNTPPASSIPPASRSSVPGPYHQNNGSRSTLRNLKCNSISDDVPPRCSHLESKSVGKNSTRKRSLEGESSLSHRGRKITTPSPVDRHISPTSTAMTISASMHSRSSSGEDNRSMGSNWTQRSMNVNTRMRNSSRQNGRNSSVREPANGFSLVHDNRRPFSGSRSYRLSSSNVDNPSSRMHTTSTEHGLTSVMNHDVLHQYNIDGIVEVLLALERIERNEELTHEQILALETSLFLSGLNLYDEHRDMRLDIDNMSYEDLLALEDRMGTVSTALSEEALSKCLKRNIYQTTSSNEQTIGSSEDGDGIKCSICQDEYVKGDEIGKLVKCKHGYHAACINQWLKLKNWCPICKASAEPSELSSSL